MFLCLFNGDSAEGCLILLTEIDICLRYISEDIELISLDTDCCQSGGEVLIYNSLNASLTALIFNDRDTAATDSDYDISGIGKLFHNINISDFHRFR